MVYQQLELFIVKELICSAVNDRIQVQLRIHVKLKIKFKDSIKKYLTDQNYNPTSNQAMKEIRHQ